jgi:PAS domain S-box-containing protein
LTTDADSREDRESTAPGGVAAADLARFFDAPLDLLCIADTSGRFRRVNVGWSRLLGYPPEELEGRLFLDFVHPEDISSTLEALDRLRTGEEVAQFVNRYRGADGSYRWIEWRTQPSGELIYSSARDITKRVRTEEALRVSEKRLEDLMLVVGDWMWETDTDRVYVSCSGGVRNVLGYAPEEVIGKTPWDFMVPEDVVRLSPRALEEGRAGLGCSEVVKRNLHRDGHEVVVVTSCVPIFDAAGTLTGFRGVDKDITSVTLTEESLRRSVIELNTLWRISETVAGPEDLFAAVSAVMQELSDLFRARLAMAVIFGAGVEGRHVITADLEEGARYDTLFMRGSIAHFSLFSEIARGGAPVAINDLESGPVPSAMRKQARELGFSRVLVVPLVLHAEVIGALVILRGPNEQAFEEREIELAQAAGGSIAASIVHARLREEENLKTASQVRDHLARELHDAVTQSVYSASLIAQALPTIWERAPEEGLAGLGQLQRLVRSALAELRILLYELRPATLAGVDLSQLLGRLADSLAGQSEVEVDVDVEPGIESALPAEAKVAMYRIAQEAFNNIAKHARATHVVAVARRVGHSVVLSVEDDGVGFSIGAGPAEAGRMGLEIMRERAREIGAALEVEKVAPTGTRILVRWTQPAETPTAGDDQGGG